MARRKKSRIKRKPQRKKRVAKSGDAPPPAANRLPPGDWTNAMDAANQVVRQHADFLQRRRAVVQQGSNVIYRAPPAAEVNLSTSAPDADHRRAPQKIHADILAHIDEVEKIIPQLPGIGHNKPPEPIEGAPPLTTEQINEVKIDIRLVVSVEPTAENVPTALGRAAERLKTFGAIISAAVGLDHLWQRFGEHLIALGALIPEYIKALMNLF